MSPTVPDPLTPTLPTGLAERLSAALYPWALLRDVGGAASSTHPDIAAANKHLRKASLPTGPAAF